METRGKVSLNADSERVNIRTTAALLEGQMSTSCPAQIIHFKPFSERSGSCFERWRCFFGGTLITTDLSSHPTAPLLTRVARCPGVGASTGSPHGFSFDSALQRDCVRIQNKRMKKRVSAAFKNATLKTRTDHFC